MASPPPGRTAATRPKTTRIAARMAHRETPHYKRYSTESADMFSGPLTRHIVNNYVPANDKWR